MSNTFRQFQTLTAGKLNRAIAEVGAQAGEAAAGGVIDAAFGYRLDRFGTVDTTGGIDMAPLINEAIIACIAAGVPLLIGPGLYRCNSSIVVRTGLRLLCSPLAEFRAHFGVAQTQGLVTVPSVVAAITQATRERDIVIQGGVWGLDGQLDGAGEWTSNYTACVFLLYVDDLSLIDTTVDGYGPGRAWQLAGDRVAGRGNRAVNAVRTGGAGGCRFIGGRWFRWSDSYIESGDDCFQFVPGGTVTNPNSWNNLSIEDGQYVNCTGYSYTARILVVGLESSGASTGLMTASIKNCAFIGCKGLGGGSSVSIQNRDSSGVIDGIDIIGCTIDDLGNDDRPAAVAIISYEVAATSVVKNIRLINVDIKRSHKLAFDADGKIENLFVQGGSWTAPQVTGFYGARLRGVYGVIFDDVEIYGSSIVDAMFIGGVDATSSTGFAVRRGVKNARIRDCVMRDIPNGQHAIQAGYCEDVQVTGCTVKKLSGATTARALYWWTNSVSCWSDRNDFRECGHATPMTDIGTGNEAGTNLGIAASDASTQSAAGGSLTWAAGRSLIRINVAGTVTSITNTPTTAARITLRAVHSSGTLVIQHGASAIRLKSSADVTLAINDALLLQYDTSNSYWFEVARSVA